MSSNRYSGGARPADTLEGADAARQEERSRRRLASYFGGRRVVVDPYKQEQFSDAWFLLAVVLTIVGVGFRREGLLLIALSLLTIVLVSWMWNRLALWGVSYRREFSERRAFCGETVDLALQVDNHKLLPLSWLRVEDTFPTDLPLEGGEVVVSAGSNLGKLSTVFSLKWYERLRRRYRLRCTHRGFYSFGPVTLESGDLFGLFRSQDRQDGQEWLIVYPRVVPLVELGLPAKDPFGDIRAHKRIFEDPSRTVGVREHQPEDDFRRIHWKATARHQRLQARDYEPATSVELVVFLNIATLERHWLGTIPELLERVVSVTASIASYGVSRRWPVGVLANGALPRSDQPIKVLPGRSPAQLTRILEALAAVTPFATSSIEDLLTAESPRLPWGATLVVVTAVVTEELEATLLRLKEGGRRLVLVSLGLEAPGEQRLQGITVYHLKPTDSDPEVLPALTVRPPTPVEEWAALQHAIEGRTGTADGSIVGRGESPHAVHSS
jgi:uncharacterized protein (DUF58 family)